MNDDDSFPPGTTARATGSRTVSLKLLEATGAEAEEEPPSSAVAGDATQSHVATTPNGHLNGLAAACAIDRQVGNVEGADASFNVSQRSMAFCRRFFPEATVAQWNDWKWQLRNRLRDIKTLSKVFALTPSEEAAVRELGDALPVGITPYYASLMSLEDGSEPIRRTMIPVTNEFVRTPGEADDPLSEDHDMAVPGLVHRYPDRVLFLVTNFCATYCRYCTRARLVGKTGEYHFNFQQYERALDYLRAHTEVRDVLLSGGDPLTMADDRLDWLLTRLRAIPHIEFVRIGSKVPAVLPQRITPELCTMLRKHHPLWLSIHFMHPEEVSPEVHQACGRLADAGIPLGSQTVLTRGVNDDVDTMKRLMHRLLMARVRPYYIYQCDPISGSSHFRTPVETGLRIIEGLRGHTTGYAVPQFVIDAPGGGGKIPLLPDYLVGREGDEVILRNFEGKTYRYPDPL
ncbi:MAG: KamA family radical SAM protein [Phycisphaerae bacterium]|nr:KamA family radical SAM protein [Phycisphaerae bacterium]